MKNDMRRSRPDARASARKNLFGSVNRDGNTKGARILRKVKGALLKGQQTAVIGARAFDKGCDVQPLRENALRLGNGIPRALHFAAAIHRDKFAESERVAEDGQLH